ncbi:glycosyl transferase family 1 [Hydrococcus rivularis NIES-593]|uniref:Glycosyl transferase family 1 n=1 Tax=Hydrococcus rivularis NIES-593 TaxID=1921803 RepID=A0A1U7HR79_9CYAN|nr:glycosyltransferase family 4 protein [Hydrococcus rivularis]OKH26092.1 glycosyl transferase family 1 [Hydrococcus rivularis NIES-593]
MSNNPLRVLLIIEQCNPERPSVPLVGYNFYKEIAKLFDVTLVTHERNKIALQKRLSHEKVIYISESNCSKRYYQLVARLTTFQGRKNWPLYNALCYPIYEEFNRQVYRELKQSILKGDYDIVHAITPMMPRYPVKVVKLCQETPFILGPVNGGVPFPPGFKAVARQEFAYFNFLRGIGRSLIPDYAETYQKADRILAGSTYTFKLIKKLFNLPERRLQLFYENGVSKDFLIEKKSKIQRKNFINLLFVGRLVPYKGADILLDAVSCLETTIKEKVRVTFVGDGSERSVLENKVRKRRLTHLVDFVGWLDQEDTLKYYRQADIFCFPSIREFGGAVILEAMACGLPCIVANNGGIGEYVTEKTGFKIEPISREYLTQELAEKIILLVKDESLRQQMSANAIERAREFEWGEKAKKIAKIYYETVEKKKEISGDRDFIQKDSKNYSITRLLLF